MADGQQLVVSDIGLYPWDDLHFYHQKLGKCSYNSKNKEITTRNYSPDYNSDDFQHYKYADKPVVWYKDFENRVEQTVEMLTKKFEEIGVGADLYRVTLMNLRNSFPAHTDGKDFANKRLARPSYWPNVPKEEWYKEHPTVDFAHQGLITLIDEAGIGETIIFKQRFPYSVYYQPTCTVETCFYPNKQRITILENDNYQLYGHKIVNFTNQPMTNEDYDKIYSLVDDSYSPRYPIDAYYGLQIDKILKWDTPGTLTQWDGKTFHMVKPWIQKESNLRLALQYETTEKENLTVQKEVANG